jgi:hypothetical protein
LRRERTLLCGRFLRNDANNVVDDLKKSALDIESLIRTTAAKAKHSVPKERHHRRMSLENADFAIVRRRNNHCCLTLEEYRFGRNQ